ncbi:MAG: rhodanese-like domain-containing protein [Eubacteriales bacterium]|nr:rhodanese-like domain-containing protein [Eubacteriales bacterium]NLO13622.1 rhodanese-like domain-containing protein [Clostridiales bacterium]
MYRRISPQEAKAAIDAGENPVIVDVREPFEFVQGHIPGAINLPLGDLSRSAVEQLPDKDALIYLYCRSGSRSASGAYELIQMGYTNLHDLGGIIDWPYEVSR